MHNNNPFIKDLIVTNEVNLQNLDKCGPAWTRTTDLYIISVAL